MSMTFSGRRFSDMRYWLILAAGLMISAAPPPAAQLYVVGCGGQIDIVDTATGKRARSVDISRSLPIARSQTIAGATFDGCILNQAVYVPSRAVFYSVVPDQFSDKSDGTKDYHIFEFTVPGLQPKRLVTAGTSLDVPPLIAVTREGNFGLAGPAPVEVDLASFTPKGGVTQNQILETSGDRVLMRLFTPNRLSLAVADTRHKVFTTLAKLPVTTALNAHLAPGGSVVYVEEVGEPPKKTGRSFVFNASSGRRLKTIVDPRISTMSFVAVAPNGNAVYRAGDHYAVLDLSSAFAGAVTVQSRGANSLAVFFVGK